MNNPWICPRCDRVNAPWVAACNCKSTTQAQAFVTTNPVCQHCNGTTQFYDPYSTTAWKPCPFCKVEPSTTVFPTFVDPNLIGNK